MHNHQRWPIDSRCRRALETIIDRLQLQPGFLVGRGRFSQRVLLPRWYCAFRLVASSSRIGRHRAAQHIGGHGRGEVLAGCGAELLYLPPLLSRRQRHPRELHQDANAEEIYANEPEHADCSDDRTLSLSIFGAEKSTYPVWIYSCWASTLPAPCLRFRSSHQPGRLKAVRSRVPARS